MQNGVGSERKGDINRRKKRVKVIKKGREEEEREREKRRKGEFI